MADLRCGAHSLSAAWLQERHKLDEKAAHKVLSARLPQGYGRFGPTATETLIDALTHDRNEQGRVTVCSEAVSRSGLGHHSDMRTGEVFEDEAGNPTLPYYGLALERHIMPGSGDPKETDEAERIGRFTNPTVHIALNQLRRVVNTLIRTYGPPKEIALELARELKLSEDEKKERNRENAKNRAEAQRRSRALLGHDADGREIGKRVAEDTGANRALLKLWEELNPGNVLDRRCIYTGQQISIDMLFSGAVEVDHILPFDATLDDSHANKIVCMREANRSKRKRSPFEAWGNSEAWPEIAERASRLPKNKRWRFEPDAMQRFAEEGGFLARHLVDTQYLGRRAREYLTTLYPERGEGSSKVWVSPGRLTEMVRRKLGLNTLLPDHNFGGGADQPKNRLDHRHHAIDAVVVGILDRSMLNRIAAASAQGNAEEAVRVLVPEPWPGFRDELQETLRGIVVSHRPDHGTIVKGRSDGTAGRLHNDTAYGFTGETDDKGNTIVVRRVPLEALKKQADVGRVRDPVLRQALLDFTAGRDGKAFEARIAAFPELGPLDYRGIRRVRITEPLKVIPIRDKEGRAYKGYKGDSNFRYDVWELPDGKWVPQVTSMFEAHQPGERPRPHPAARRMLQLFRDDVLAVERGGGPRELLRVVKFSEKQFALAPLNEGGALKARDADKNDPFKYVYPSPNTLRTWRARKVEVDEIGRVRDGGWPIRTARRATRKRLPSGPTLIVPAAE